MLGLRQVMPGWANDPVWRHHGRQGREGRVVSGKPPPGGHRVAGGKGRSGLNNNRYITISDVA